jgi:hypothetical protein
VKTLLRKRPCRALTDKKLLQRQLVAEVAGLKAQPVVKAVRISSRFICRQLDEMTASRFALFYSPRKHLFAKPGPSLRARNSHRLNLAAPCESGLSGIFLLDQAAQQWDKQQQNNAGRDGAPAQLAKDLAVARVGQYRRAAAILRHTA